MSLVRLLHENYYDIIEEADDHMHHSHLRHYCNIHGEKNSLRIKVFLDLLIGAIRTRNLAALLDYTENTAIERFETGADLCEVQRAINGLEKAIWEKIVTSMKPEEHAGALGLINTILDEAKDTLACRYVHCARQIPKSLPQISFSV